MKYKQQIDYLIFGVLTTLVNWIVYTTSINILEINITISNAIAWFISVIFAYFTNKIYVFKSKEWNGKKILSEIGLFFGSRAVSGAFEIVGFPVLYHIGLNQSLFRIKGFWAKALISLVVIVLNYIFSKLVVFKGTNEKKGK